MIDPPILSGHWSIERAPSRNGPWRYASSLKGDLWCAIRAGLESQRGAAWVRIVRDGIVERALYIRSDD
jgi:hypothetical protein